MAVAPGSFFEYVGPFGPQNDHYIRDNASFSVALGLSHLVDIGEADPDYYGPVEFALLFVGAVVLTATLVLATRESDAQS